MIGKLTGILDSVGEDRAIIDVGGVGYLIFASSKTLGKLGGAGAEVGVFIETHVREDHIHLYAFADLAEQECFRLLTTVQGVGAKVALAILSTLSSDELIGAISMQDKNAISRANGVGPKLAARIASELKDKVAKCGYVFSSSIPQASGGEGGLTDDALSALLHLGYKKNEAESALRRASDKGADTLDDLIRAGLKELAR